MKEKTKKTSHRIAESPLCSIQTKTRGARNIHHGWTKPESLATNAEQQVSKEQKLVRGTIDKTINSDPAHRIQERYQGTQLHD